MQSIIVLSMKQPQEQKTMRGEIISYDPVYGIRVERIKITSWP